MRFIGDKKNIERSIGVGKALFVVGSLERVEKRQLACNHEGEAEVTRTRFVRRFCCRRRRDCSQKEKEATVVNTAVEAGDKSMKNNIAYVAKVSKCKK